MASVYRIDPLRDPRWKDLVGRHPRSSVFHTREWLEALRRTYDYEPFVLTTAPAHEPLANGVPFCGVPGWGGRRVVSLPFSDHCEPLVRESEELSAILSSLVGSLRWESVELRPRSAQPMTSDAGRVSPSEEYAFHSLDLSAPLDQIESRLHPSCIRRAVRRAGREGLTYESGRSRELVARFYRLFRMTRRRHGLPPQPIEWFRNLVACFGEDCTVRLASRDGQAIAAMLTLSFRETMVYKYGGSDARAHHLGGMPFLFWHTIREARARAFSELDLGRSDIGQTGLIAFKERLGGIRASLTYYRSGSARAWPHRARAFEAARRLAACLPEPALVAAGRLLYRHFG